jgi:hypothetical protein
MKTAKPVITFVFLVVMYVGAAYAAYHLTMRFGVLFGGLASVFGLFWLLGALCRAPEGYQDENGFHIHVGRKQVARPRQVFAASGSHG